jgi:cell division protein FtsW (lipid II flippase)
MTAPRKFLYLPLGLAIVLAILGLFITFVPGAETGWFLVVAALSISGLFIPRIPSRIAAALLLVFALGFAYEGYQRGVEYREKFPLRERATP